MTGAIGHLQSKIVACTEPELISRKIIRVQPTNLPTERWVLDSKAVAYRYVQGTAARLSGAKNQFIDINMDITAEASNQWTRAYIEDYMTPHAIDKITQSLAKALATHETNQIITLYQNIQNTDFAGGAPIDQENQPMNWNAILKLHYAVRSENYHPKILVLNTTQLSQLLTDTRFIDRDAYPSQEQTSKKAP